MMDPKTLEHYTNMANVPGKLAVSRNNQEDCQKSAEKFAFALIIFILLDLVCIFQFPQFTPAWVIAAILFLAIISVIGLFITVILDLKESFVQWKLKRI